MEMTETFNENGPVGPKRVAISRHQAEYIGRVTGELAVIRAQMEGLQKLAAAHELGVSAALRATGAGDGNWRLVGDDEGHWLEA
jgi:hypothetical protein